MLSGVVMMAAAEVVKEMKATNPQRDKPEKCNTRYV